MIDRVKEKLSIKPQRFIGDTNYGIAAMLGWLVNERGITLHVPVWDKSEHHDGTFSRSDFVFESENNHYVCPAGKYLKPPHRGQKLYLFRYRASLYDCQVCELKPKCCPNISIRKIDRSPHEAARNVARAFRKTEESRQSRRERKKVEILFAHLKRVLKLGRLQLRGPSGAHDEFLLAPIAQSAANGQNAGSRKPKPELDTRLSELDSSLSSFCCCTVASSGPHEGRVAQKSFNKQADSERSIWPSVQDCCHYSKCRILSD